MDRLNGGDGFPDRRPAWETKRAITQPAEFILGPDRRVLHSTYSSGPVGRIVADDALALIRFLKSRRSKAG